VIDAAAGTVALADPAAKIDLGGIAKGYALDRARTLLRAAGVEAAYLDLGGNVATLGRPPDGPRWRVGIAHPRRRDGLIGVVEIGEASVSTSGDAEQWVDDRGTRMGHIVDPRSGRPVPGVLAVTVIAPSATLADALSTAAVVRGGQDMEPALRAAEAEAVVARVHAGGRIGVTATPGARLVPVGPESSARTGERP
jgi:thiamine biosynthesis lipoprotein ApbE